MHVVFIFVKQDETIYFIADFLEACYTSINKLSLIIYDLKEL